MRIAFPRLLDKPKPQLDPARVQQDFLGALNEFVALDQLLDYTCGELRQIAGASEVIAVLREPITNRFTAHQVASQRASISPSLSFTDSHKLLKWLSANRTPFHLPEHESVLQYLPEYEQVALRNAGVCLVIPCFVLDRTTTLFLLTAREGGGDYHKADIELLSRLAAQAALAIEHAKMYQLQEERLKKLFLADKLATVGELASRAAHEIRNPLAFIRSTIQLLTKHIPDDKTHLAAELIKESDRIDAIITGLLSLSRSSASERTVVDLRSLIDQTLPLVETELRARNVTTTLQLEPGSVRTIGDAGQLRQLLLNLLINSLQAMPGGGTIRIGLSEGRGEGRPDGQPDSIFLTVSDTGEGIPQEILPKVFDPFFTTKESGTGLGLSICYGIVANHGGEMEIRSSTSAPQTGTTVTIRLPREASPTSEPA